MTNWLIIIIIIIMIIIIIITIIIIIMIIISIIIIMFCCLLSCLSLTSLFQHYTESVAKSHYHKLKKGDGPWLDRIIGE